MSKKHKYLWTYSDEDSMVFWSKSSDGKYLTTPTEVVPKSLIRHDGGGEIQAPPKNSPEILPRFGILHAGFSRKAAGYFHIIGKNKYTSIVLIESGSLRVRKGKENILLKRNDILIVPQNVDCGPISTNSSGARIFWAHICGTCAFPDNPTGTTIRRCKNPSSILNLSHAYEAEIYSAIPSIQILTDIASALSHGLRREISVKKGKDCQFTVRAEKLFARIGKGEFIATSEAAHLLSVNTNKLDAICLQIKSMTFSKYTLMCKMKNAAEYLARGFSATDVSGKVGYATVFAFSRAFKKYFGLPPSKYAKLEAEARYKVARRKF